MLDIDRSFRVPLQPLLDVMVPANFPDQKRDFYLFLETLRRNLRQAYQSEQIAVVDFICALGVNVRATLGVRVEFIREGIPVLADKIATASGEYERFFKEMDKFSRQFTEIQLPKGRRGYVQRTAPATPGRRR